MTAPIAEETPLPGVRDPYLFMLIHVGRPHFESSDGGGGYRCHTALCPICPADSGSSFMLRETPELLLDPTLNDDTCQIETVVDGREDLVSGPHRIRDIVAFLQQRAEQEKREAEAEEKARRDADLAELARHYREVRSYRGEDGKLVIEWEDPSEEVEAREPGCDDDAPTSVAAGQPASNGAKSGPLPLRDLLFSPSRDSVRATPPRRRFLLTVPGDGTGVFPAGKVGVLSAPGGTGKSYALMHIAFAVATGSTAFGEGVGWKAEGPGRVLFLFGEDDREEVDRRLHHVLDASGLISDDDVKLIERNLDLMPLCGQPVALTTSLESGVTVLPETQRCEELRQILGEAVADGHPYTLVVLDPLSRFAGPDVEIDNAAATRFIQVLESLASPGCGGPSLLISHHERKRQLTDDPDSADPMRGASALKDGVRWVARLEPRKRKENGPDLLKLRVVKTNYTKPGLNLTLCRPPDWHGALRVATDDEIAAYEQSTTRGTREAGVGLPEKILAELARGAASTNELAGDRLHVNKRTVSEACDRLEEEGQIQRQGKKWALSQQASPERRP
ncbi:MAG TPA: AAA family ATPase [Myxococcales bacterium]